MVWEIRLQVTKKKWLSEPKKRWNAGLDRAGFNFRQGNQREHYPPVPPHTKSVRTYATADKAGYRIVEFGRVMVFGSTFYLPFILDGTRKWEGWPGHKAFLRGLMEDGFRSAIVDYEDES